MSGRKREQAERVVRASPVNAGLLVGRAEEGSEAASTERTIKGLAIPWDTPTRLFGKVWEEFARGSIDPAVASATETFPYSARLNLAHDSARSVANVDAGTLAFFDAEDGLRFEATVDTRDSDAADMVVKVERGDYTDVSIEFDMSEGYREERVEQEDGKVLYRVLETPKLWGAAVLAMGAYPTTEVEAKGLPDTTRAFRRQQEAVDRILDAVGREAHRARLQRLRLRLLAGRLAAM